MRHYKKGRKLGTDASHTKAMKKSLVNALFLNDRIKTVEARAKEIRGDVDRIITWAKKGDLHSRRLAIAALGDKELVREIFEKVEQGMFKDRNGGYTRIMKLGYRKGDNAPIVIMELINEPVAKKSTDKTDEKKATTKTAAKKTADKKAEKEAVEELEAIEEEIKEEAEASVEAADAAGDEKAAAEAAETAAKADEAQAATEKVEAESEKKEAAEAKEETAEAEAEAKAEAETEDK